MSRLFVCLWPPDDVIAELEELHRKDQVGARFVPPENWHVTLRFIGDADPNDVADALAAATFRSSRIELGPAVDAFGERLLAIPASGADALAGETVRVTRHLGSEPVRRNFRGHVTIARLKRRANMPRVLGALISTAWTATDVALVESRLHPDGARYETLASFPTDPGEPDEPGDSTDPGDS